MMTKKDFIVIAKAIKEHREFAYSSHSCTALGELVYNLANEFILINPNFDRNRFLEACGVD